VVATIDTVVRGALDFRSFISVKTNPLATSGGSSSRLATTFSFPLFSEYRTLTWDKERSCLSPWPWIDRTLIELRAANVANLNIHRKLGACLAYLLGGSCYYHGAFRP
jgi:hypothetical protein